MTTWLFVVGGIVVAAAWVAYRGRLRRLVDQGLSDGDIQAIEAAGRIERDDPLDLEEAAEEEEQFWSETWDEPEPF